MFLPIIGCGKKKIVEKKEKQRGGYMGKKGISSS
jgi:hypothetical protein